MKNIEIELRALVDKNKFIDLNNFLKQNAKDLGEDNKDTYFFLFPDKLLKVTNNITKNSAKITLKLNKIGVGNDFREIEIPINPKDIDNAVTAFKLIGLSNNQYSFQFRHNYLYKGIEIAIKYTQSWGFHVELEIMVGEDENKEQAIEKIKDLANELNLEIMSDQQLKEFTSKIDSGWNRGEYTRENFKTSL